MPLPVVRIGRKPLYDLRDVIQFVEARKVVEAGRKSPVRARARPTGAIGLAEALELYPLKKSSRTGRD